jgi:hypothetical protein
MARELIATVGRALRLVGLQRARDEPRLDPRTSYMDDEALQQALLGELARIAGDTFAAHLPELGRSETDLAALVRDFWRTYRSRPFADNQGGSGFHNAFWIWLVARTLAPRLIVESGVWKGHTSWLLGQACPEATVLGFDLDLSAVEHGTARVRFHQHDWSSHDLGQVDPERALAFFDCHVDHARRIQEAHERGFRHLLFDDNPPLHKLHRYGLPGVPTVAMIMAGGEVPERVSWHWRGQPRSARLDAAAMERALRRIERYVVLPDVGTPSGYGGFSFLSYVRLARP